MSTPYRFASAWLLVAVIAGAGSGQTQVGFRANLSSLSTVGVSGIIEITGPTTLRLYNFTYDGRGGGRTELTLLPDRDQNTLRNLNLLDSPFQGFDNGTRGTVVSDPGGQPTFQQVPLDPIFPAEFQLSNGQSPPFFPVEFDGGLPGFDDPFAIAQLRGPSRFIDDPAIQPPGALSNIEFDVTSTSDFGDNGEELTDFAGISVFCIPFGLDFGSGIFTSPADSTNDGVVDAADLAVARDSLGAAASSPVPPPDIFDFPNAQLFQQAFEEFVAVFDTPGELADANFDGQIDVADYAVFIEQFGTTAAAALPNTAASISAFDQQHSAPAEGAFEALFANLTGNNEPIELPEGGFGPFAPVGPSAAPVPEPGTLILAACFAALASPRRRR